MIHKRQLYLCMSQFRFAILFFFVEASQCFGESASDAANHTFLSGDYLLGNFSLPKAWDGTAMGRLGHVDHKDLRVGLKSFTRGPASANMREIWDCVLLGAAVLLGLGTTASADGLPASRLRTGRATILLAAALYQMRLSADAFACSSDSGCDYDGCCGIYGSGCDKTCVTNYPRSCYECYPIPVGCSRACPDPPRCPPGKWNSDGYNRQGYSICIKCPAGSYASVSGVTSCSQCAAGTYSSASGATISSLCLSCLPGSYSSASGTTSSTACSPCAAGTYDSARGSSACSPCATGTYGSTSSATRCLSCFPGTYSGASGSSACSPCAAGTYSSVIGATDSSVCLVCSPGTYSQQLSFCVQCGPVCNFGFFESTPCALDRDRVCTPYQYPVSEGIKFFIVFGQAATVVIVSLLCFRWCLKDIPLKDHSKLWVIFTVFIGLWDFISDLTMLSLIEPLGPYGLFWVSWSAIILSVAVSGILASLSKIQASWPVKTLIFIASGSNLFQSSSSELLVMLSPEFWNYVAILVIEQAPQLVVQGLLLYLQGLQGFSWLDWAIWCQSAFFTALNVIKNIVYLQLLTRQRLRTTPGTSMNAVADRTLVFTENTVDGIGQIVSAAPVLTALSTVCV
jgi:hypothetical protein